MAVIPLPERAVRGKSLMQGQRYTMVSETGKAVRVRVLTEVHEGRARFYIIKVLNRGRGNSNE